MSVIYDILGFGINLVAITLAVWLTAKVLKFKKQDVRSAAFFALVYYVVFNVLGSLLGSIYTNGATPEARLANSLIYGLILWAILLLASIKVFYREGWIKTIAAVIITTSLWWIIGFVLIQIFQSMGAFGG